MRSLWHRFVHNLQHLGRQEQRYEPRSLAARQAQSMRLRTVEADPIESFPEPDPMRPSLDLSECEIVSGRCAAGDECPCWQEGWRISRAGSVSSVRRGAGR